MLLQLAHNQCRAYMIFTMWFRCGYNLICQYKLNLAFDLLYLYNCDTCFLIKLIKCCKDSSETETSAVQYLCDDFTQNLQNTDLALAVQFTFKTNIFAHPFVLRRKLSD